MRKPIRYYITKTGEEPTVRSVKVALAAAEATDLTKTTATTQVDPVTPSREAPRPIGVRRLVKSAMRRRSRSA